MWQVGICGPRGRLATSRGTDETSSRPGRAMRKENQGGGGRCKSYNLNSRAVSCLLTSSLLRERLSPRPLLSAKRPSTPYVSLVSRPAVQRIGISNREKSGYETTTTSGLYSPRPKYSYNRSAIVGSGARSTQEYSSCFVKLCTQAKRKPSPIATVQHRSAPWHCVALRGTPRAACIYGTGWFRPATMPFKAVQRAPQPPRKTRLARSPPRRAVPLRSPPR